MTLSSNVELNNSLFFKHLVKCPSDRIQKLLHHLVDVFCGQQNSYSNYSDMFSLIEWWDLVSASTQFFKELHSLDTKIPENLDLLQKEYQDAIKDVLDVRSSDLKNSLIEKSHAVSSAYLKSFDWKVKLTLASDKMSQINEPRLLLDLDITEDKCLQLDLSKEELKSLIDTMEKAKYAVVDLLEE